MDVMMQMEDRVRNRRLLNFGLAALVAACAKEPTRPADTPAPAAAPVAAPAAAPVEAPATAPAVVVPEEQAGQLFKVADLNADGLRTARSRGWST